MGRDGAIYVDAQSRPASILRFSQSGAEPDETPLPNRIFASMASVGGGKSVFGTVIGGKARIVAMPPGGEFRPFLQTAEESTSPFGVSVGGNIAFRLGTPPRSAIAVASVREGRILRRLSLKAEGVRSVALSPDSATLFYASGGAIWSVPLDESAAPHRITDGDEVVVDPTGRFLYIKQLSRNPIALARLPLAGGSAEPITLPDNLRFTSDPLSTTAVDRQGRVLFEVATADSFFFSAALYDPARKSVSRIPVKFEGDVWCPNWTSDGRISAEGARYASTAWRYHR